MQGLPRGGASGAVGAGRASKGESDVRGHVRYRDVHFSYDGEHEVLCGLDLDVPAGATVALVGPSGGGKTTTCSLLPRFYDPASGSVEIDGIDVRTVTVKSLRDAIGIVQQDVYLFGGTIRENIAYGRPDATMPEIVEAAAQGEASHDFIESLPHGYDTPMWASAARGCPAGRSSASPSRACFCATLASSSWTRPRSALDNESERAIQKSLGELSAGRTTLVIAHRLSTIRGADLIAVVDGGRVVELGTHEQLRALGGTYAHYCALQFGNGSLSPPTRASVSAPPQGRARGAAGAVSAEGFVLQRRVAHGGRAPIHAAAVGRLPSRMPRRGRQRPLPVHSGIAGLFAPRARHFANSREFVWMRLAGRCCLW